MREIPLPGSGLALGFSCAAMTIALLASPSLPMTDLPQHEAQLALWERMGDPAWPGAERLRINWATPYLGGYLLGRALMVALPIGAALHLVVTLSALAFPLALRRLVVRLGGDPWWALLGVPVALGFPFFWGFINFLLGTPVILLTLERAVAFAQDGRRRDGCWLAVLGVACLASHFLVWCWAVGAGLCVLQLRGGVDLRARLMRSIPLLAGAPVAAAWLLQMWSSVSGATQLPTLWEDPLARAARLPEGLFGGGPAQAASAVALLGLALIARPRRPEPWRAALFALALLTWAGPLRLGGTYHACERFVPMLLPGALALLGPREPGRLRTAGYALLFLGATAAPLVQLPAWNRFAADVRDLEAVAAPIETGSAVYAFVAERRLEGLPGQVAGNLPARLQVGRDVWVDYSFARSFPSMVRLRREEPWDHEPFQQSRDPSYRWLLVRWPRDPLATFSPPLAPADWARGWTLHDRRGKWWLYRRGGG